MTETEARKELKEVLPDYALTEDDDPGEEVTIEEAVEDIFYMEDDDEVEKILKKINKQLKKINMSIYDYLYFPDLKKIEKVLF